MKFVDIFVGNACNKVFELEEMVKPDFIVLGVENRNLFEKLIYGNPEKIVSKTKTPVIVCKKRFVREELREEAITCPICKI